jgi:hypothetical protein
MLVRLPAAFSAADIPAQRRADDAVCAEPERAEAAEARILCPQYSACSLTRLLRSEKFIIHHLDDCHLLVQAHAVAAVAAAMKTFQESNTYTAPGAAAQAAS